jgi:hypothetical protein
MCTKLHLPYHQWLHGNKICDCICCLWVPCSKPLPASAVWQICNDSELVHKSQDFLDFSGLFWTGPESPEFNGLHNKISYFLIFWTGPEKYRKVQNSGLFWTRSETTTCTLIFLTTSFCMTSARGTASGPHLVTLPQDLS